MADQVTELREPLAFGAKCPHCGTPQKLLHPASTRCPSCKARYVEAPPPPPAPGSMVYKVLTQRDEWFMGKFSPEKLEAAINHYARDGWKVVGVATADVGAWWGSFGGGQRQEIVVFMEKPAGDAA